LEEDPAYYPADRDDDDDDDDEDEDKDEEVEEEHPTLAIHITSSYGRGQETSCLNHPTTITTYSTIIYITTDTITTITYTITTTQ
ncbi:hypothetical protein Tco_0358165, partial [Tanacetum coccineum]